MYSNMKDKDLRTPFYTFISGTLYSFIKAGRTVNGPQVSATIAIATVVQTLFCLSYTLKLLRRVASTSYGPIAFAIYPNVFTVALLIPFL